MGKWVKYENALTGDVMYSTQYYCWQALARQLPILYNSEKKAKSVRCKTENMRSRLCFLYLGIPGCL